MSVHKSVLLKETVEGLNLESKFILIDGTFGGGGHTSRILNLFPNIKIIAIDKDGNAIKEGKEFLFDFKDRISFYNESFTEIDKILKKEKLEKIDAILLDLGLSSDQLENSGRGFSFLKDEELLMNMKSNIKDEDITARDIVNTWDEENLRKIIFGYGEEKFANRIARKIVEERKKKEIKTTSDLVKIIEDSVPRFYGKGKINKSTKTFQALRIAVNDELRELEDVLEKSFNLLNKDGRLVIISFHSLEDRIVKKFFKKKVNENKAKLINKKIITPKEDEIKNNKRSRSAKLRILEKIL